MNKECSLHSAVNQFRVSVRLQKKAAIAFTNFIHTNDGGQYLFLLFH